LLECGMEMNRANEAMLRATKLKKQFVWLGPPPNRGSITVADVQHVTNSNDHMTRVRQWAESAWQAWSPHHSQVRLWLPADFASQPA
jgi:hypothetical protein